MTSAIEARREAFVISDWETAFHQLLSNSSGSPPPEVGRSSQRGSTNHAW